MLFYVFIAIFWVAFVAAIVFVTILDFKPNIDRVVLARAYVLCPLHFFVSIACISLTLPPNHLEDDTIMLLLSLSLVTAIIATIYFVYKGLKTYGGMKGCRNGFDKLVYITTMILFLPAWLIFIIIALLSGDADAAASVVEIASNIKDSKDENKKK